MLVLRNSCTDLYLFEKFPNWKFSTKLFGSPEDFFMKMSYIYSVWSTTFERPPCLQIFVLKYVDHNVHNVLISLCPCTVLVCRRSRRTAAGSAWQPTSLDFRSPCNATIHSGNTLHSLLVRKVKVTKRNALTFMSREIPDILAAYNSE